MKFNFLENNNKVKRKLFTKKNIVIFFIFFSMAFTIVVLAMPRQNMKVAYGVTFSKAFAQHLGLDWKETYLALLDDAGAKKVRLPSYWSEIENERGTYFFQDLDWQISEAEKRGVAVVLALGQKQPRWPECHIPVWAENLSEAERQDELIKSIVKIVNRYKDKKNITAWQIENEPFLPYGECPKFDKKFLDREIAEVKKIDDRLIIISDSGELGTWYSAGKRADILGTTLYRIVWNDRMGYIHYPTPSVVYRLKAAIIMFVTGVEKIIIVELQGEPWGPKMIIETTLEDQYKSMGPEQFQKNIDYVKGIEFSEAYLWGGEWWYWLKTEKNDDRIWNIAKKAFRESPNLNNF
ncbi:cellulase family glycosylhydrolase [Candidatus Parcubacteria bacterium]|nr:cellulase family glycosylhydrolase [Candidatus Parcubacteria bacterium]